MSTNVSGVTSHFPKPQPGFTTTTSGSVSSGASTVGLNSTGNYSNGDIVALVIDPTDSNKKQVLVGTVDTGGVQLTGVIWTDGTNQSHASGATVVDMVTATYIQMMTKGMLVQHKQDGTHADTITTNTIGENTIGNGVTVDGLNFKDGKLNTNNSVVAANITPAILTNSMLSTADGELGGALQSWTPTFSNIAVSNSTVVAKYIQIGKTVFARFAITFAGGDKPSGVASISLPVTASSNIETFTSLGQVTYATTGRYHGFARLGSTTTADLLVFDAANTYLQEVNLSSTTPGVWANGHKLYGKIVYDAA